MTEVTKTQNKCHSMTSLIHHVHRKRNRKSTVVTKMQNKFPVYFYVPFACMHWNTLPHNPGEISSLCY